MARCAKLGAAAAEAQNFKPRAAPAGRPLHRGAGAGTAPDVRSRSWTMTQLGQQLPQLAGDLPLPAAPIA